MSKTQSSGFVFRLTSLDPNDACRVCVLRGLRFQVKWKQWLVVFINWKISFRNWKLEMLRFLKNKLSRISAAHHFYLAHSLTLSFIGGYVGLFECFSFDWKWKFHQEKQIFWGYENFLSSHEYISLSEKNVGVIVGSFILCVTHCRSCCKTYDTWVEISLFFFFVFCFWVRQDIQSNFSSNKSRSETCGYCIQVFYFYGRRFYGKTHSFQSQK